MISRLARNVTCRYSVRSQESSSGAEEASRQCAGAGAAAAKHRQGGPAPSAWATGQPSQTARKAEIGVHSLPRLNDDV